MSTLAIIGTAGRRQDGVKLTPAHWRMMCCIGQTVATTLRADRVVSGGAGWADAVAVWLFKNHLVDTLALHLPAPWDDANHRFVETDCGRIANHYHAMATAKHGEDGLADIAGVISNATVTYETAPTGMAPFFARNAKVARDADALLPFTFAEREPNDGGTRDTWDKWMARRAKDTHAANANGAIAPWREAYHFSLSTYRLSRL